MLKNKKIIIGIIVGISFVALSSFISIVITKEILLKEMKVIVEHHEFKDVLKNDENLLSKLKGGWKSKDSTCSLIMLSGKEFTCSCYLYINDHYGYISGQKEDFVILDSSHFRIGDLVKYFYLQNDESLIVGGSEYVRAPSLVEEDFSCVDSYDCSLYEKIDRHVLSVVTE